MSWISFLEQPVIPWIVDSAQCLGNKPTPREVISSIHGWVDVRCARLMIALIRYHIYHSRSSIGKIVKAYPYWDAQFLEQLLDRQEDFEEFFHLLRSGDFEGAALVAISHSPSSALLSFPFERVDPEKLWEVALDFDRRGNFWALEIIAREWVTLPQGVPRGILAFLSDVESSRGFHDAAKCFREASESTHDGPEPLYEFDKMGSARRPPLRTAFSAIWNILRVAKSELPERVANALVLASTAVALVSPIYVLYQVDRIRPDRSFYVDEYSAGRKYKTDFEEDSERYLEDGHKCADYEIYLSRIDKGSTICYAEDGVTKGPARELYPHVSYTDYGYGLNCCIAIEEGSNEGVSATIRRAMRGSVIYRILFGLLAIAAWLLAFVASGPAFGVLMWVVTVKLAGLGAMLSRMVDAFRSSIDWTRVQAWVPLPPPDDPPILCQITDLHQCRPMETPYEISNGGILEPEGVTLRSDEISSRIARLARAVCEQSPRLVAMTGDLVDTGDIVEWNLLRLNLGLLTEEYAKEDILVCPGNHDVSFNQAKRPDPTLSRRRERLRLFVAKLSDISTGCVFEKYGMLTDDVFFRDVQWGSGKIRVFTLNSCTYGSTHLLSNAVGELGERQRDCLRGMLLKSEGPVLVMLHHHVAWRGWSPYEAAMSVKDSQHVVTMLLDYADRSPGNDVLVLHGHRHVARSFRVSSRRHKSAILVHGSASSTLGEARSKQRTVILDGVCSFTSVWYSSDMGWTVRSIEVEDGI